MDDTNEPNVSPGGSEILRHAEPEPGWRPADTSDSVAEEISRHLEGVGLSGEQVFHEIISHIVHIDVHMCPPTHDRPWWVLYTTGMSDLPMTVPDGHEEDRFAEVMIGLPPNLMPAPKNFETGGGGEDDDGFWPIRLLKFLARYPHEYETWLGIGHTMPTGGPIARRLPHTGIILLPPVTIDMDPAVIPTSKGPVNFLAVVPLFQDEMDYKLSHGVDGLLERFNEREVNEVFDPVRRSSLKRKRFLGLF